MFVPMPARSVASKRDTRRLASVTACRHPLKRSLGITKLGGAKDLNACIMLAIKWCDGAWATCFYYILRVVEPQAQMVSLDRVCLGILRGIWNTLWIVERIVWSRRHAWRHDEGLNIETADELGVTHAVLIGFN